MNELALSWLYGVLSIASVFICVGTIVLWRQRMAERERRHVPRPDRYLALIVYAGLHGAGGVIHWTLRTWDAIVNDRMNVGSLPWLMLVATGLYALGKAGPIRASSLNGKPWVWWTFLAGSTGWSLFLWWDVIFNS